jgi:integrase
MSKRMNSKWGRTVGDRPYQVRVYERKPGSTLYLRKWDPTLRRYVTRCLKHRDRDRGVAEAKVMSRKLEEGERSIRDHRVSLIELFALYAEHRTPQKSRREQGEDRRRIRLWTRFLGARKDPLQISRHEWDGFIRDRTSGRLAPTGEVVVDQAKHLPARPRTVERDLRFLLSVLNWGSDWRVGDRYLLRENCCRGFPVPKERNPRRPVASLTRYHALRLRSDEVVMQLRPRGHEPCEVRSHLSELLDLAIATGRRLSAICGLWYSDLQLARNPAAPFGAIRWRASNDKEGREAIVPMNALSRRAIDRIMEERPGLGDAPLFPSPGDIKQPVNRHLADRWLRKAESLAGIEPQAGGLWHPYRRLWATLRKDLPAQDVARAGGWASTKMVLDVYTQADAQTTLGVVLHDGASGAAR